MSAVGEPAARQPDRQRVHRPTAERAPMLDVVADGGQRAPQPALYGGLGQTDLLGDLAIGKTAEIRELDDVRVFRRKGADRIVDGVADHRAREIPPGVRVLLSVAHALEEHPLEPLVRPAHTAAVDRRAPGTRHEPRPPGVVRGTGKRVILGFRHLSVLRCTGNSERLQITRTRFRPVKDAWGA